MPANIPDIFADEWKAAREARKNNKTENAVLKGRLDQKKQKSYANKNN